MDFIEILKLLNGQYVHLGLVNLTDIAGKLKLTDDAGEIVLETEESQFTEYKSRRIQTDLVDYILILNPKHN
ncbi:MAG: hypothetical protein GF353_15070 [Candidatus Lokiarchaeota archaeon]|nr:hypothetical protein [Candidatus Lokiarchaeota archaeon]